MDGRGARILSLRIAVGAAAGERVEVVSVDGDGDGSTVRTGERGTLLSIEEAELRVAFDSGEELVVDPRVVQLRRARDAA